MSGLMRKNRILGIKLETETGTDVVPAAADAIFRVFDFMPTPDIEYVERESGGGASRATGSMGARGGSVSFKLHLYGTAVGAAPVPGWADIILPSMGLIKSTATYAPATLPPGLTSADPRTVTIYVWEGGRVKSLVGCLGNGKFILERGRPGILECEYKGVWAAPADGANPTSITRDAIAPPRFVSAALTIGSWTPVYDRLELDLGNDVQLREDGNAVQGYSSAIIADRRTQLTIAPEAALIATNDTYAIWLALTTQAISFSLGTVAGNKMTFTMPNTEIINVVDGERAGTTIDQLTIQPLLAAAGDADDELTILFVGT